jgi:hypothetical protein
MPEMIIDKKEIDIETDMQLKSNLLDRKVIKFSYLFQLKYIL